MSRYYLLEEEWLLRYTASPTSIQLLDNPSEQHQTDVNDRKGQRGKIGRREGTSNKGTLMTLVEEETHRGMDTPMGTTGMKGSPSITTTIDQREVLPAEISSKKHHPKISDQQSRTLGGGPGVMGCLAGSEAKTDPEQLKIYATC